MNAEFVNALPAFNACCNATSAISLIAGWLAIRARKVGLHKKFMLTAFAVSMLFLAGYLTRHAIAGSTKFQGQGVWRTFYFALLLSHTVLAVINLPLIIITLRHGLLNRIEKHRRLARFTLPLWFYVSSTGVLIYFMLYQWFRP